MPGAVHVPSANVASPTNAARRRRLLAHARAAPRPAARAARSLQRNAQRQAVAQKKKEDALAEALRVQEQAKKDARERNKRIDVIRKKVQAGFIPQSKLQDHIDDIIQEVHGTEDLEKGIAKDNARLDKRAAKKAAKKAGLDA